MEGSVTDLRGEIRDPGPDHARRVEEFEAAEAASHSNREKAARDIDYYDGRQWTEEELRQLRRRGQPAITFPLIKQKIDFLQGLERAQRTRPRALPRTPAHEEEAAAASDALAFVAEDNRYDQIRSRVWKDILTAGWGGVEAIAEDCGATHPGAPRMRIRLARCPWDRMFWDPHSSEEDFSDAAYLGLVIWMDREEAICRYGEGAAAVFDDTISAAGSQFDDRPRITAWVQHGRRRRVRVVQEYYVGADGEWDFCEFTKGGVLRCGPSPWRDEHGLRAHPFAWHSAYVDRDNNRYGAVRDLVDVQDEVNKRRSKALHHFTTRQTFGTPEAQGAMSVRDLRRELARPDGHVQLPAGSEWGRTFGIIPTGDQAAGHFELLQQAIQAFEALGPNAAMQGKSGRELSGRAILAEQQGGSVQMGALTDTLRDLDHGIYRKVWNLIRRYWTGETWLRVTDDSRNLRWVGLNMIVRDEMGSPVIDPRTGLPIVANAVAELDVDILIDDAPDMGTLQHEQFELLVQLKTMDRHGEIPLKAVIAAAPGLRAKDELIRAIEAQESRPDPALTEAELRRTEADIAGREAAAAEGFARARKADVEAARLMAETIVPPVMRPIP